MPKPHQHLLKRTGTVVCVHAQTQDMLTRMKMGGGMCRRAVASSPHSTRGKMAALAAQAPWAHLEQRYHVTHNI